MEPRDAQLKDFKTLRYATKDSKQTKTAVIDFVCKEVIYLFLNRLRLSGNSFMCEVIKLRKGYLAGTTPGSYVVIFTIN